MLTRSNIETEQDALETLYSSKHEKHIEGIRFENLGKGILFNTLKCVFLPGPPCSHPFMSWYWAPERWGTAHLPASRVWGGDVQGKLIPSDQITTFHQPRFP